jgi:hypothetical protein
LKAFDKCAIIVLKLFQNNKGIHAQPSDTALAFFKRETQPMLKLYQIDSF